MKRYSNIAYALINLLGVALGMDKKSYEERLKFAAKNDFKAMINSMDICDDNDTVNVAQAEMLNAVFLYNDAKKGIGRLPMFIDMGCSGASIQE